MYCYIMFLGHIAYGVACRNYYTTAISKCVVPNLLLPG